MGRHPCTHTCMHVQTHTQSCSSSGVFHGIQKRSSSKRVSSHQVHPLQLPPNSLSLIWLHIPTLTPGTQHRLPTSENRLLIEVFVSLHVAYFTKGFATRFPSCSGSNFPFVRYSWPYTKGSSNPQACEKMDFFSAGIPSLSSFSGVLVGLFLEPTHQTTS